MVAIVMGDDKCEFLESDWRGPNFDWAASSSQNSFYQRRCISVLTWALWEPVEQ
jgi:hypothetical protein